MTDSLEGLSVELRKAVQCMQTHYPANKKAHEGKCVYWLPAGLAAQEMRDIIAALKAIKNNDKSPAYTYSSGSKNREGKAPKRGQRWATPYEIVQEELQRLENVKEALR